MFNFIKRIFKQQKVESDVIHDDTQRIINYGNRLVEIINESLKISNNSKNIDTKVSRLSVAKENLKCLKELTTDHAFLSITALKNVEKSIIDIEHEITQAKFTNSLKSLNDPNLNNFEQSFDVADSNSDICEGVKFNATLDVTTPLKYLLLDQCIYTVEEAKGLIVPSKFGYWNPYVQDKFRIITDSTRASKFGPVPISKEENWVLQSLIKFREIMEQPIDDPANLRELHSRSIEIVAATPEIWASAPHCLHFLFKELLIDLKHITPNMLMQLLEMGFTTFDKLKMASEKDFKSLDKIGQKKAKELVEQLSKA